MSIICKKCSYSSREEGKGSYISIDTNASIDSFTLASVTVPSVNNLRESIFATHFSRFFYDDNCLLQDGNFVETSKFFLA